MKRPPDDEQELYRALHKPPTDLGPLFDQAEEEEPTGEQLRDEGMAKTDGKASARWKELAHEAVVLVSGILPDFTTDDVWAALEKSGRDVIEEERNPSAMGPVMRRAAFAGIIIKTGATRPSTRATRHVAELRVWRKTTPEEYRNRA